MFHIKTIIVGANDKGQRLDRFLCKAFPLLSSGMLQKCIRNKRIKVDGARAKPYQLLAEGSVIELYVNDEYLEVPVKENEWKHISHPRINVVYEDDNVILIDKPCGMPVQPDSHETVNTLVSHLKAYANKSGMWDPDSEISFAPALCNRIDRNTRGIVIAAKNAEALRILNQKIKDREIEKYYLCIVHGETSPASGRIEGYLFKDASKNRVFVHESRIKGSLSAVTEYKTVKNAGVLSLVECRLITGRTHQIRAQLAHKGNPLLGDGKYGREEMNKPYGVYSQVLWSYKTVFDFSSDSGILNYLKGKSFSIDTREIYELFSRCVSISK